MASSLARKPLSENAAPLTACVMVTWAFDVTLLDTVRDRPEKAPARYTPPCATTVFVSPTVVVTSAAQATPKTAACAEPATETYHPSEPELSTCTAQPPTLAPSLTPWNDTNSTSGALLVAKPKSADPVAPPNTTRSALVGCTATAKAPSCPSAGPGGLLPKPELERFSCCSTCAAGMKDCVLPPRSHQRRMPAGEKLRR